MTCPPFEYPSRWQQLYEAFLSQDEGRLQQAIAQLEERDIALEDHLRNWPCGGGTILEVVEEDVFTGDGGSADVTLAVEGPATLLVVGGATASNTPHLEVVPLVPTSPPPDRRAIDSTVPSNTESKTAMVSYRWEAPAGTSMVGVNVQHGGGATDLKFVWVNVLVT